LDSYHFGGLRVKEITTYDENNNPTLKKTYSYVRPDKPNLSSGYFYSYPNHMEIKEAKYASYRGPNGTPPCGILDLYDGYALNFSYSSYFPLIDLGNYITYTNVEEKEVNVQTNQVITNQYQYGFVEPYFHFPSEPQSRQWESGNLGGYHSVNTSKTYNYDYHANTKSIKGIDTSSLNFYTKLIPTSNCSMELVLLDSKSTNSVGGSYELFTNYHFMQKEEITKDNITTKNEFFYNNPNHYQLTKQKTTYPDNSIVETTYQYAHEKGNTRLINANTIGIPLETSILQKQNSSDPGKIIGKAETKYDHPGNLFPSSVLSFDLHNTASMEVTYDKYDLKGNLQQYTTKDGIPVAIIWGYNGTQPIAKVVGATYAQVSSLAAAIITASNTDASAASNNDETAFLLALDAFRKNTALQNAQITAYTYDPLIGVTSITPPSGIREIYKYDSANRLESIQDVNGKIIKEFLYNYKH